MTSNQTFIAALVVFLAGIALLVFTEHQVIGGSLTATAVAAFGFSKVQGEREKRDTVKEAVEKTASIKLSPDQLDELLQRKKK